MEYRWGTLVVRMECRSLVARMDQWGTLVARMGQWGTLVAHMEYQWGTLVVRMGYQWGMECRSLVVGSR